jgi:hypothetical protein
MLLIVTDHALQREAIERFLEAEHWPVVSVELWPASIRSYERTRGIQLDENLVERHRDFRTGVRHCFQLLQAKLVHARAVLIATRETDEGHVNARDIKRCLEGTATAIFRIALQGLSHACLAKSFAREAWTQNFEALAHVGDARRIVYHAINGTFVADGLAAGPLGALILASIEREPLPVKRLEWSHQEFGSVSAMLPVHLLSSASQLLSGDFCRADYIDARQLTRRCSTPWRYWEMVCHGALRLGRSVFQVAAALEQAWLEGRISDPGAKSSYLGFDAQTFLADLADHNRCDFDAKLLVEFGDGAPPCRPLQADLSLGVSITTQSEAEAITTLVARNLIEAGQEIGVIQGRIREFDLLKVNDAPRNNWLRRTPANLLAPINLELSVALRMAKLQIPAFSSGLSLIGRMLDSGLVLEGGELSARGQEVLAASRASGLTGIFNEIECKLIGANADSTPSETAWLALRDAGILQPVLNRIVDQHRQCRTTSCYPIRSLQTSPRVIVTAAT